MPRRRSSFLEPALLRTFSYTDVCQLEAECGDQIYPMRCQLKEPANQKKPSQSEETEENLSSGREAIAEGSLQLRERRSETSDSLIEEKLISHVRLARVRY